MIQVADTEAMCGASIFVTSRSPPFELSVPVLFDPGDGQCAMVSSRHDAHVCLQLSLITTWLALSFDAFCTY